MADKKISALTAATTPLAGTEVLPIVQSGSTVKVAVSDLTAGRSVSAASLALTTSPLPATSGGTGQSSAFTANAVVYSSSTSALATGSVLFFDGTNFGVGGTTQSGTANKSFVKDSSKFQQALIDTTAQAAGVGGAVNLGGNYRAAGDAQAFTCVAAEKVNSTDANYAYNMAFYTTANGGASFGVKNLTMLSTGDTQLETGNLIVGVSGKGIDFSATAGTGTSELLADYEEGTWTPRNGYVTLTNNVTARYTKVGRFVYATFNVTFPVNSQGNLAEILDLPFSASSTTTGSATFTDYGSILMLQINFGTGGNIYNSAGTALTNANLSGKQIIGMYVYSV